MSPGGDIFPPKIPVKIRVYYYQKIGVFHRAVMDEFVNY